MKISVIIPTYKPGDYLFECLESLQSQTFPKCDYEVLLILNGVAEPYNSIINNWISAHTINVNLFVVEEAGVSNARNVALDAASGDYITFIDDDDIVSDSYLMELYACASREVVSVCFPLSFKDGTSNYEPYSITKDYYRIEKTKHSDFWKVRRFFNGPVYKLIHKDIIGSRRFNIKFKNGEDSLFMFQISDKLNKVECTSRNAIYYRRFRCNSASQGKSFFYIFNVEMKLLKEYSKIYWSNIGKYNFIFYVLFMLAAIKMCIVRR